MGKHAAIVNRPKQAPAETRGRVLEVAEQLFAERGIDAVSIRDIISAAGANLGAINYHFGTKERLIEAVFERRLLPSAQQRLRALEAVEKAAGDRPPELEAVLEAFFRPVVEEAMDPDRGGAAFKKLMARSLVDPNPVMERVMKNHIPAMVKKFDAVLLRAMPGLDPADVFWRMHLLMGGLHQSLLLMDRKPPPGVPPFRLDAETYIKRFVAFAAAAFRAPLPKD
ncbi:MAG: TetR/AcrR family transcriptional regulator [Verrucomicrobiales bacterium]|nr:TetR/AcrR family transcriptional regulator [Verrucomicrobiales bacterium]